MGHNQSDTFTDRHEANALFKKLCVDDSGSQQLLPFLTFLAPGGGGKTSLIEFLSERCRNSLPYAGLDFTKSDTPKTLDEVLTKICDQLLQTGRPLSKKLAFPRFYLGASIIDAPFSDRSRTLRSEIENQLTRDVPFLELLAEMGSSLANLAPVVPPIITLIKRSGLRHPIQRLRWSTILEWYSRSSDYVGEPTRTEHTYTQGINVLIRLRELSRLNLVKSKEKVERLLFAAFLEDLRSVNDSLNRVVLFLDGFEAISGDASKMGLRLLNILVKQRSQELNDPLLLVIGSAQRLFPDIIEAEQYPSFEEYNPLLGEEIIPSSPEDPIRYAERRYNSWLEQLPKDRRDLKERHLYLPVWLHDFGEKYTSFYVDKLSRQLRHPSLMGRGIALYQHTHGHTLALRLAAEAICNAERDKQALLLKNIQQVPVPQGILPDRDDHESYEHSTVGAYLLSVFLRQLSNDNCNNLMICAIPRVLDIDTLKEVLQPCDDKKAQGFWNRYRPYAFTSTINNQLVLHPALRNLLLEQIEEEKFVSTNEQLRRYYDKQARLANKQAGIELAYHALALRDPEPAITLALSYKNDNDSLDDLLKALEQTPIKLWRVEDIENEAVEALYKARRAGMSQDIPNSITALLLYRWLVHIPREDQQEAADVWHSLGDVYRLLPIGDQSANQRIALHCFKRENLLRGI